tara:strand:- start:826 stop:1197 length:372 start_codon:yes stop_codon:yes gene_type:complete
MFDWEPKNNSSNPDANFCDGNCEEPTISKKAKGFFSEMRKMANRMLKSGDALCSKDIQQERLKICLDCQYATNTSSRIKCSKCGCYMEVKTWISSSECPIKKWESVPTKKGENNERTNSGDSY